MSVFDKLREIFATKPECDHDFHLITYQPYNDTSYGQESGVQSLMYHAFCGRCGKDTEPRYIYGSTVPKEPLMTMLNFGKMPGKTLTK